MKKINNMSDLEKKAIKVINGMLVVWPQSNTTESLEIMGWCRRSMAAMQ